MADRKYRVRKPGESGYTEVSEQEYLDAMVRQHRVPDEHKAVGQRIFDAPEKGEDIELNKLPPKSAKKKAGRAYLKGLGR